jgi:hypothetical protein
MMALPKNITPFQSFAQPSECPDYVYVQCPICGLFVGDSYIPHPPARGVWLKGSELEERD